MESETFDLPGKKLPEIVKLNNDLRKTKSPYESTTADLAIKVYPKRWLMLLIFNLVSFFNAFQWVEYCIIGNIVKKYYNISSLTVDATAMVFLFVFLPLMYPASCIMDKKGLRYTILLAAGGTCLGSWIKIFSIPPELFYIGFIGQTLIAMAQLFTLSTPALLAATWFGEKQVSTACGLGVIGLQLGPAICFLFTPILVHDSEDMSNIASDLKYLFWVIAISSTLILISVILFFEKEPKLPPSKTQAMLRKSNEKELKTSDTIQSFKRLSKNGPLVCFLVTYGINMGAFCYLSTLLNPIVLAHFPAGESFAGQIGLILTAAGIVSSSLFGYILDKTRKYKETSTVVYVSGALAFVCFAFSLGTQSKLIVVCTMLVVGFCMSGFFSIGFEIAAEMSYPEPETNSSGILNLAAQVIGIVFTLAGGYVMENYGDLAANVMVFSVMAVGGVILILTPKVTKRQDALKQSIKYDLASQENDLLNVV